jgi:hypothetical protein
MSRPNDISQETWDAAVECGESVLRNLPDDYGDVTDEIVTIARALMAATARQREADALIAESADRPGRNTGSLVAAAIRKGGA